MEKEILKPLKLVISIDEAIKRIVTTSTPKINLNHYSYIWDRAFREVPLNTKQET